MEDTQIQNYLSSVTKQLEYYKLLAEKTFDQVEDEKLFWLPNDESNSIAIIVNHLSGNMISRWTDFLTTDGEKEFRQRDQEFEDIIKTKKEMLEKWESAWSVLFNALASVNNDNFCKLVYIRNMGHSITEAINRQLCHYSYHIGQIVFLGKIVATKWNSLSIPKGASQSYNDKKFSKPKQRGHFTDDMQ